MKSGSQNQMFLLVAVLLQLAVTAQDRPGSDAQEIAVKLNNPVANMISVPLQSNLDYGIGPNNGSKYTLNVQPVVPVSLSKKLNLITRYIIPVVDQRDITGDGNKEFGLGDATVSGFFSPVESRNGLIWGAGPAFLIPIGTDLLSTKKWGIGPTALVLRQSKGLTYGLLTNQIWSVAGEETRSDVSQLFVQPFFAYNWKGGGGIGFNSEMTFDWEHSTTTAFLNPIVTGITKLGRQAVSLGIGPRIPLAAPSAVKPDFGLRAVMTFVFPN